jgi:hypothetical protein
MDGIRCAWDYDFCLVSRAEWNEHHDGESAAPAGVEWLLVGRTFLRYPIDNVLLVSIAFPVDDEMMASCTMSEFIERMDLRDVLLEATVEELGERGFNVGRVWWEEPVGAAH